MLAAPRDSMVVRRRAIPCLELGRPASLHAVDRVMNAVPPESA